MQLGDSCAGATVFRDAVCAGMQSSRVWLSGVVAEESASRNDGVLVAEARQLCMVSMLLYFVVWSEG